MAHMHSNGWFVWSEHRGVCFWNDYFLCGAMASSCVVVFSSLSMRQSSGVEF